MMWSVHWLSGLDTWQLVVVIVVALIVLAVVSAVLTAWMVRRGLRTPSGL